MNRIYRLLWNHRTQSMVAVAEKSRGRGKLTNSAKSTTGAVAAALLSLASGSAMAESCTTVGTTTISTAVTDQCLLGAGESLFVNGGSIIRSGDAVLLSATSVTGSISNTGTISNTNSVSSTRVINGVNKTYYDAGVQIYNGTLNGNITNAASGTIGGSGEGISVVQGSLMTGNIVNSGVISGNTASLAGIGVRSIYGTLAQTVGSTLAGPIINNQGARISGYWGIRIYNQSSVTAGVSNSGHIQGNANYGVDVAYLSTFSGGLTNAATGTISSSYGGVNVSSSLLEGGIRNAGTISGNSVGLLVNYAGTVTGGVTNSGKIIGGGYGGIYASTASVSGGINNQSAGQISGTYGIWVGGAGANVDGVTNAGTITGSTNSLRLQNTGNAFSIRNSGTLEGAASIGINTLHLDGSSARVNGDVTSGASGTVNVNGTFTSEGTFNVGQMNVTAPGVFTMQHNATVANGFTNSGTVAIAAATASTVAGSYTQSSIGVFRTGVSASSLGKLTVSDTVTLPANANFDVVTGDAASCRGITLGGTIAGVITATGTLTWNDTSTVTDDCTSLNFVAQRSAGNSKVIDLVAVAPPPSVSGGCGTASGLASAFVPVAGLCTTGTSSLVTAAAGGYSWSCAGTNGGATAQCSAPGVTTSGGTGTYRSTFELVSGTGCVVRRASVQPPPSGGPGSNVQMPYGVLDFKLEECSAGIARVRMTYSASIEGMQFYKYINPNWVQWTTVSALTDGIEGQVVINGNTATFNIRDNGAYDADSTLGVIVDPGGPGFAPSVTNPQSIPTLSEWGLIFLSSLMAMFGIRQVRRGKGVR